MIPNYPILSYAAQTILVHTCTIKQGVESLVLYPAPQNKQTTTYLLQEDDRGGSQQLLSTPLRRRVPALIPSKGQEKEQCSVPTAPSELFATLSNILKPYAQVLQCWKQAYSIMGCITLHVCFINTINTLLAWVWWLMLLIPAFKRQIGGLTENSRTIWTT